MRLILTHGSRRNSGKLIVKMFASKEGISVRAGRNSLSPLPRYSVGEGRGEGGRGADVCSNSRTSTSPRVREHPDFTATLTRTLSRGVPRERGQERAPSYFLGHFGDEITCCDGGGVVAAAAAGCFFFFFAGCAGAALD